jgi:hypothetical protein
MIMAGTTYVLRDCDHKFELVDQHACLACLRSIIFLPENKDGVSDQNTRPPHNKLKLLAHEITSMSTVDIIKNQRMAEWLAYRSNLHELDRRREKKSVNYVGLGGYEVYNDGLKN